MELHILAYLSNDPQLLYDLGVGRRDSKETAAKGDNKEAPERPHDTFKLTASRLFNCPPEKVTKELRSMAKTVTYGEQQQQQQQQQQKEQQQQQQPCVNALLPVSFCSLFLLSVSFWL